MITVVCGEDTAPSRTYFSELKNEYRHKGDIVQTVLPQDIGEIQKWLGNSPTLFGNTTIFFTQDVNRKIGRGSKEYKALIDAIAENKDVHLVDWEEVSARELKLGKKVVVKEFKPNTSIFQLLDICMPGKKHEFIRSLGALMQTTDATFVYLMLVRHVRKLVLASAGVFDSSVAPWQRGKLAAQAKAWKNVGLIAFYEALHRLDIGIKTSTSPYTLKQSLDILAVYFL